MLHYRVNANAASNWPKVDRPTSHSLFLQDTCFLSFIFLFYLFSLSPMSQEMSGCYNLDPLCPCVFLLIYEFNLLNVLHAFCIALQMSVS